MTGPCNGLFPKPTRGQSTQPIDLATLVLPRFEHSRTTCFRRLFGKISRHERAIDFGFSGDSMWGRSKRQSERCDSTRACGGRLDVLPFRELARAHGLDDIRWLDSQGVRAHRRRGFVAIPARPGVPGWPALFCWDGIGCHGKESIWRRTNRELSDSCGQVEISVSPLAPDPRSD